MSSDLTDMGVFMKSQVDEGKQMEPELFYAKKKKKKKKKKKLDHNVREKLRRIRIKDSYYALLSLLPDYYLSTNPERRWSAPMVVDRVLNYIPELQKEVEKLEQRKENILLSIDKENTAIKTAKFETDDGTPKVSVTETDKGQVIVQICIRNCQRSDLLSTLLAKIEHQGMSITSSSTLSTGSGTVSYSLHLQMKKSFYTMGYACVLRDKIVSWLCEKTSSKFSISTCT